MHISKIFHKILQKHPYLAPKGDRCLYKILEDQLKILIKKQLCVVPNSNLYSPKTNYFCNHIHHVMAGDNNQKSIKKLWYRCIFLNNDCVVPISTLHASRIKDFYNHIHGRRQQNDPLKNLNIDADSHLSSC